MSYFLTVPYSELTSQPPGKGVMYSPRLPTVLEYNGTRSKFYFHSVVDSGADYRVFPSEFGKRLGIDIQSGTCVQTSGFGGGGHCYYHNVNVFILIEGKILKFPCSAGFSDRMNELGIGLLGRHGFFELFEEVIFDQKNKIFKLKVPGEIPVSSINQSKS